MIFFYLNDGFGVKFAAYEVAKTKWWK